MVESIRPIASYLSTAPFAEQGVVFRDGIGMEGHVVFDGKGKEIVGEGEEYQYHRQDCQN